MAVPLKFINGGPGRVTQKPLKFKKKLKSIMLRTYIYRMQNNNEEFRSYLSNKYAQKDLLLRNHTVHSVSAVLA